ncbi:MAG TPA: ribosome maturation factor RimM [Puia sp.]|nr:ribosome maturation factor RimM [Puia sp.]
MKEYRNVGRFVATHGYRGELILSHHLGSKNSLKEIPTIFIHEVSNSMFPYFVEQIRVKKENELVVKIEGIDSKESAEKLLGKEAWLEERSFRKHADSSSPASLVGFHLVSQDADLGEIYEVIEMPHQLLCKIKWKEKEALIPLHDKSLIRIDKRKREVHVELPDGLLDIYR